MNDLNLSPATATPTVQPRQRLRPVQTGLTQNAKPAKAAAGRTRRSKIADKGPAVTSQTGKFPASVKVIEDLLEIVCRIPKKYQDTRRWQRVLETLRAAAAKPDDIVRLDLATGAVGSAMLAEGWLD